MNYPKDHPIWPIVSSVVYLSFATLFLYLNASNFDSTEVITLGQIALASGGIEVVKKKLAK